MTCWICCGGRPPGGKFLVPRRGRAPRRYLSDKQRTPPSSQERTRARADSTAHPRGGEGGGAAGPQSPASRPKVSWASCCHWGTASCHRPPISWVSARSAERTRPFPPRPACYASLYGPDWVTGSIREKEDKYKQDSVSYGKLV